MQSLFFFIIALSVLITIHEYGHFWVARRCGVKVLRFSFGFGKPLWRWVDKQGTEFVIAPLPLGGYVKMLDERGDEPIDEADLPYSFNRQSLAKRAAIVFAGPAVNLLFAVLVYWGLYLTGIPGIKPILDGVVAESPAEQAGLMAGDEFVSVNGQRTPTWNSVYKRLAQASEHGGEIALRVNANGVEQQHRMTLPKLALEQQGEILDKLGLKPVTITLKPVIGQLVAGEPAEQAGLHVGDTLISADGVMLEDWAAWVEHIQQHGGKTMAIVYQRDGQRYHASLTPVKDEQGIGRIGAGVDPDYSPIPESLQAELRYGVLPALTQAIQQTWIFSATTLKSFFGMLTGSVSTDNLGGPISIAQLAGSSAEQGAISFFSFLAIISITLGILNLLPIPMLDGGHLAMFLIEAVRGKPVSVEKQITAQRIGLVLLLTLMFLAFSNDLIRLFG